MALSAVRDPSPEVFLERAGPFLYADEPTNSLMLGLCNNLLRAKEPPTLPPVFIRILGGGRTVTAAIQTPPMNLVIMRKRTSGDLALSPTASSPIIHHVFYHDGE